MLVMCPILYRDCDVPASPPASVSVLLFSVLALFFCYSLLLPVFPPSWPPPSSVSVPLPPFLLPPSPPSSAEYMSLCPPAQIQEHFRWELLSPAVFCPS